MGWLRKTRIFLISTVAVALIVLAVAFTLLRTLLPHATGYIAEIEKGISSQIGLPVSIGSLDAEMHWFTPRLKVLDLVIYKENGKDKLINLTEATISLAYIDSIRFMMPMAGTVSLHGAEIFIERHPNDKWVIQGFEIYERESSKDSEELVDIILSVDIALIDSQIHWRDYTGRTRHIDFHDASVRLENELGSQYFEIDVSLPADMGERFRIMAQIDGDLRDFRTMEAQIYVGGKGLVFENWVDATRIREFVHGSGRVDVELWTHIINADITRFSSRINASDLELSNIKDSKRSWRASKLQTNVFWRSLNEGWRLDVRDLHLQTAGSVWPENTDIVIATDLADWRILASFLKPSDIIPLLGVLPDKIDVSAVNEYAGYMPAGALSNFEAIFTAAENPDLQLSTGFTDIDIVLPDRGIAVRGLDGELMVDSNDYELLIESRDVIADTGGFLRWPLQLDSISGKLAGKIDSGKLSLESPALRVTNQHIETVTRLFTEISADNKVFIDMQSNFANGKGEYAHQYIPVAILPEGLVSWLDNAFVSGHAPFGSFVFRGVANEYPFADNQGVMQVQFDVEDGTLHFLDGWPDVKHASATVRFHNASLAVENARSHEDTGSSAFLSAEIPDLKNAILSLYANIEAPADELQQYVWNSGLESVIGRAIEHFQASGLAEIDLALTLPLGKTVSASETLQVEGDISFKDNELFFPIIDYQLADLNGTLSFTTTHLSAKDIQGNFYGQPVSIDVVTSELDTGTETRFYASGTWSVDSLLKVFDWNYPALLDGKSHWDVVMHVPHKVTDNRKVTDYDVMFNANSDLKGVKIGISDIIRKPADKSAPLSIEYKILDNAHSLKAASTDILDLNAVIDEENNWRFDVASPVVSGNGMINANLDLDTTAKFDFEYLDLTAVVSEERQSERIWKPTASSIPSLDVNVDRFRWYDWKLTNVAFTTDRHPRGMVVNDIKIDDPRLQLTGKGSWLRRSWRLDEETTFSFNVSSPNLGDTLQQMGYSRYVDKSKMQATLHWHWPGAPYRFDWESLSGNTSVELGQGVVTDIDPGAGGRFLGLLNLLHLPKRLSLDFADVYEKGFVFDSVTGSYVFGGGDAVTQDTEITASAADLTMMGRIGVADQDYDLVSVVRPHSSVATFAGGTLVAGPTVGVGLAILQEIFGLDLLGKDVYTIKGSWTDPVINQITSDDDDEPEDLFGDFE